MDSVVYSQILDRMCKPRDGEEWCAIKVFYEGFMVNCSGHKDDLQCGVAGQKLLEFEQEEIAINGSLMNLAPQPLHR